MGVGNPEDAIGQGFKLLLSLTDERNDRRAPRLDFHQIAHGFFVQSVPRGQHHHRHVFVDQGNGAMFHFSRRISFRVDVGNFFELECAFQRNRIIDPTSEIEKVVLPVEPFRHRHEFGFSLDDAFDVSGQSHKLIQPPLPICHAQDPTHSPDVQGQEIQGHDLAGEGLGRGHADLRAATGVNHAVGFPGQRAADDVHDRQDVRTQSSGFPGGSQRIRGFSRLRQGDKHVPLLNQRVAIPEFRTDIDLDRCANEFLKQIFPNQSGVPGRSTRDDPDRPGIPQFVGRDRQIRQIRFTRVITVSTSQRIENGLWLLMNFLEHEVRVPSFFRGFRVPVDFDHLPVDGLSISTGHRYAEWRQRPDVPVFQKRHVAGVGE